MSEKNRINRVVTGTGDRGSTGLADGSRVRKCHPRIEALGTADEFNAAIGVLRAHGLPEQQDELLEWLQQRLFDLGAELAMPEQTRLHDDQVTELESRCDVLQAGLPPLREFVLPGGSPAGAWCHYCRTVARRLERRLVRLAEDEPVRDTLLVFCNRLSDLLFMLARGINRSDNPDEPQWQPSRPQE